MSLTNPRVEYIVVRDALKDLLIAQSAVVNSDLKNDVKQTISGNPLTYPVPATMYPSILIRLDNKDEKHHTIGGGAKDINIHFSIFGIVREVSATADSDDEAIKLADNIEAVFRDNISIAGAVAYCNPGDTEFGLLERKGGGFVSMTQIKVSCFKRLS